MKPATAQPALATPVLLTVFNRPETTRAVFEAIREARPSRLYVAADGPRPDHPGDATRVEAVRSQITEGVDWDCEVQMLFRSGNLGCKLAVSGAVSWFFEREQAGIILEDDCLPNQSFFSFCEQMLDRYRDDERVMHVAGACLLKDLIADESYFFSKYPPVWGWATWRDAWSKCSLTSIDFEAEFDLIAGQFPRPEERAYWKRTLGSYFAGDIDTWDYPWAFSIWRNRGLAVYPTRNMVSNIGFGSGSTHTRAWRDYKGLQDADRQCLDQIVHPEVVALDEALDRRVFAETYRKPPVVVRAFKAMRRLAVNLFSRAAPG